MKKLLYIVFLLFPLQLVFAQTSVQDLQISLAREIAQQEKALKRGQKGTRSSINIQISVKCV